MRGVQTANNRDAGFLVIVLQTSNKCDVLNYEHEYELFADGLCLSFSVYSSAMKVIILCVLETIKVKIETTSSRKIMNINNSTRLLETRVLQMPFHLVRK